MYKKYLTIVIFLSILLLITACTSTEVTFQPTDTPVPMEVDDTDDAEHQDDADDEEQQDSADTESESPDVDAAALFASNCAGCHGGDRSGGRGPALLPERLTGDAAQYSTTITNGRGGMPSFSSKLSQDEINALAEWILTTPE